jgi:hypothetical protein
VTALAPAPPGRDPLVWLTPSPLWQQADVGIDRPGFEQPWLVELVTDDFLPAFLGILSDAEGQGPLALADLGPADGAGTHTDPTVLYQPVHGCFYLVLGSLVCRRAGLPDREVLPRGQRVSFVVRRRLADGSEQAWLASQGAWSGAADPEALVPGEEQHPMQAAVLGAPAGNDAVAHLLGLDEPGRREIHYGYVPVAARAAKREALADPVAALTADPQRAVGDDARLMEFRLRIAGPWSDIGAKVALNIGVDVGTPSLFLLLDLRDWLSTYLPDILNALTSGTTLPAGSAAETLRAKLAINVKVDNVATPMGDVLRDLAAYMPLVTGVGNDRPQAAYDVHDVPGGLPTYANDLAGEGSSAGGLVLAALVDPSGTNVGLERVPSELAHAVVPRPADPVANADRHVLRLVYEHAHCVPVVSKPTPVLRFAGTYDANAPARSIRIELPDPSHLRRFKRGVAMDMPPELRRILDRVTPDVLKDKKLNPEGGWQLGMICSFSIQIIMLVAFIVMFIFLILLNIVFWWLAFLKICFPVPMKKSS